MPLQTKVYVEYEDKKLNGSSHFRNNDIPITIEIVSDDNPTIQGSILSLVFTHYAASSPVNITKSTSGEGANMTILESSFNRLVVTTNLLASNLSTLPTNLPIRLDYRLNITLPDTDTSLRTIEVGSLTSIP